MKLPFSFLKNCFDGLWGPYSTGRGITRGNGDLPTPTAILRRYPTN